jgi:predicted metal-dependent hydrolase
MSEAMTRTAHDTRPTGIPVRRPAVDLANAEVDRWLVRGDPVLSHILAGLAAVFPNGEDFFVDSVRNYKDRFANDPDMKARVKGFIGQESMHGREHRAFNMRLAGLGYPTHSLDAGLLRAAKRAQRLPKAWQLSITAASEHLTSTFAHAVLGHEPTRQILFPDPDVELLITWHALEELEHKDVAFDVLQDVNPSYPLRVSGMLLAAVYWGPVVVFGVARGLVRDRRHLTPRALRRGARDFARQRMLGPWAWIGIAKYLRPGFHPRDIDTDALVVDWRERLAPRMSSTKVANPTQ